MKTRLKIWQIALIVHARKVESKHVHDIWSYVRLSFIRENCVGQDVNLVLLSSARRKNTKRPKTCVDPDTYYSFGNLQLMKTYISLGESSIQSILTFQLNHQLGNGVGETLSRGVVQLMDSSPIYISQVRPNLVTISPILEANTRSE